MLVSVRLTLAYQHLDTERDYKINIISCLFYGQALKGIVALSLKLLVFS